MKERILKKVTVEFEYCFDCPHYKPITINTGIELDRGTREAIRNVTIGVCQKIGKAVLASTVILEECPLEVSRVIAPIDVKE